MSLKPAYKQTEIGVIPDDWQTRRIDSFTSCTSGGTPSTLVAEYWGGPIRWMSSGELNLKRVREVDGRITEAGLHNSSTKMVPAKCVLIGLAGQGKTRGTAAMNFVELCTNQSIAAILPSKSHDSAFLYYVLDTKYEELRGLSDGGGGRGGLNLSIIKAIQVTLPGINEQKAIAEALSDVDALTDSLEALLTKKRNIKTGAMQELLTGRTRLPGFSGDWQEFRLENFADCFDHLRIPLNESERSTAIGDYPYCGANGVLGFIDKYLIDDEMVLIAEDGGNFDEFATRPIAYKMSGKFWVNNHAHVLKAKPSQDNNYLYYSLVHKDVTPYLASGTRAKLNKSEMWKIEIRAPKSSLEQEAIAEVLSDIDDEIQKLEKRLAKTRDLKQGMAQELLTGRTRLV